MLIKLIYLWVFDQWNGVQKNNFMNLLFAGKGKGSGDPFRAYALLLKKAFHRTNQFMEIYKYTSNIYIYSVYIYNLQT